MDIGLVTGIVVSLACLVLVWPAVRRAGSGAVPMLLFWAAAIGFAVPQIWNFVTQIGAFFAHG